MGLQKYLLIHDNITVLKRNNNTYIYIYDKNTFYIFKLSNNLKLSVINTRCIQILCTLSNYKTIKFGQLNMFFQQFSTYRHIKIKFAGKGYKIKKNTQNSLVFLFNRAHITNIWWRNTITKKLKKYKIYMQGTANVLKLALKIISIRPINIFTKRGLRISRQIVLKKKGKK